jgi:shikimate 5-dehydrogenase
MVVQGDKQMARARKQTKETTPGFAIKITPQTDLGLAMLIAQAERQFEWWTGQPPVQGVMREAIERSQQATEARRHGVSS